MRYSILLKYCCFIFTIFSSYLSSTSTLQLSMAKENHGTSALQSSFFQNLIKLFHIDTFIETGTYLGNTTNNAASIFQEVHTIELSKNLYQAACERFKGFANVNVHLGNSSEVLKQILPSLKRKILFWLDAHPCGGNSTGNSWEVIFDELEIIKINKIKNAVIMVDDVRIFGSSLSRIRDAILEINNNYTFTVFGDIAIAFPPEDNVNLSPLLQAMTISRLFHENENNLETVLQAEEVIALARGEERETLIEIPFSGYYRFWRSIILLNDGQFNASEENFRKSNARDFWSPGNLGPQDSRINLYLDKIANLKINLVRNYTESNEKINLDDIVL